MPISQSQILTAIESLISGVVDTGLVLTRERNIESDSELINLFRGLNGGVLKGWLIKCVGFTQIREGGSCDIVRSIKYIIETIYPFQDDSEDLIDSHDKFRAVIEAVNASFNDDANWGLGLEGGGVLIEHQLLQATEDFKVIELGEGTDAALVHFATFDLFVNLGITV